MHTNKMKLVYTHN